MQDTVLSLNTVTFSNIIDPFCTLYPGKRLIERCIWSRPHGVIYRVLRTLQLRVHDSRLRLSPVDHSCAVPCYGAVRTVWTMQVRYRVVPDGV